VPIALEISFQGRRSGGLIFCLATFAGAFAATLLTVSGIQTNCATPIFCYAAALVLGYYAFQVGLVNQFLFQVDPPTSTLYSPQSKRRSLLLRSHQPGI